MSHPLLSKNLNKDNALFRQGKPDYTKLAADDFPTPTVDEAGTILENSDNGDRYRWTGAVWVQIGFRGAESVRTELLKTAFGELVTAEMTPITQISAPYGLLEKAASFIFSGGSTAVNNSLFEATSGTTANGLAALLTKRQVTYRAGQGLVGELTGLFDTPVADSSQEAGLIINTDRLGFGYNGTTFGIHYQHGGESEIQELTITTPAAGAESATITVDGTPYTVPLTAGTVQHNAFEIAVSLNTQVDDYDFSSNDDQVVARSILPIAGGSFVFTSATAVAAWVQIQTGLAPINDFVPQTDWNIDTRISSDTDVNLDPAKGNVYKVQMQYLGFGGIQFYIEDKNTAKFVLVHIIRFANTFTTTSVGNPTFRVGWLASNGPTNTTSITVKGGSAGGFIEGKAVKTEETRADSNTNAAVPVGSFVNIMTLRNRIVFGTRRNRAETFGVNLAGATDSNKDAIIVAILNADVSGDLDFQYIDKVNSTMEIAKEPGTVTGGRLASSFPIPSANGADINLRELQALLLPGETVTLAASITAGAASSVTISVIWQEDL